MASFSICIATFRRPYLLEKLLKSLNDLNLSEDMKVEIIIVDNDKDASAKSIVKNFEKYSKFTVKYFIEPIKNISLARNKAIEQSQGDFIAFVDDDETVDKNWLFSLYDCLLKYQADGVFGLVVPEFEEGINNKYKKREIYFSPMDETGSDARFMFAGSVLLKKEMILKSNIFFDSSYGLTGGEDANFFGRLKANGAKFVNCREALSYEFISRERTKLRFFYNRAVRGGQTYIRNFLSLNRNKRAIKVILILKSLLKLTLGFILFFLTLPFFYYNNKSIQYIGTSVGEIRGMFALPKNLH